MSHQTLIETVILPLLAAAGLYLLAIVSVATTKYVHNRTLVMLLTALEQYAAASVAFVYQAMVKELKDPTTSSVWTAEAAEAAKVAAMARVRETAPMILASLKIAGADPESTLSQFIERAVVELNTKVAASKAST